MSGSEFPFKGDDIDQHAGIFVSLVIKITNLSFFFFLSYPLIQNCIKNLSTVRDHPLSVHPGDPITSLYNMMKWLFLKTLYILYRGEST